MANTLYLTPATWDLAIDTDGNIAMAGEPYAIAQDAASAIRTVRGECWYDVTIGIPYWQDILGQFPPIELVRAYLVSAALSVPGAVDARAYLALGVDRKITGQVQVTTTAGKLAAAGF